MNKLGIILLLILINSTGINSHPLYYNNNNDSILFTPDFFNTEEPLRLELRFNIKEYKSKKNSERKFPAHLSYYIQDSIKITKEVGIEMRGISRQSICDFPPFFIKLKDSGFNIDYIANAKKLKVVTLCKNVYGYKEYLYKEYLIYKLYNITTPNSFRVRLVNFTLIDEGRKNKSIDRAFFIIEPEKLLANRLKSVPIKLDILGYKHMDPRAVDLLFMFQYMIGNTDFSITGRHNIKLIKSVDHKKHLLVPVAYDFDFAGLINTDYAIPTKGLRLDDVTERYFLGACRSEKEYQQIINHFLYKKDKIYEYIQSCNFLSNKHIRMTVKYIDEFYDLIEDPAFFDKVVKEYCRD